MGLTKPQVATLARSLSKILRLNATPVGKIPEPLNLAEVQEILDLALAEFPRTQTSAILDLTAPLTICGDTHGQFNDVLRLFDANGWPPRTRYLFLGDYVDRGTQSIETICTMVIFRLRYPKDFFILRGNHETPGISRVYGFYDECRNRYNVELWRSFQTIFSYLPICALVSQRIFCMHGGLSPSFEGFEKLRALKLPFEVPERSSLVTDTLWSDPDRTIIGFQHSRRGVSYTFGEDVVLNFCEMHNVDLIVRAHQVVENGFEFFANNKLVTLFSAPNYCGQFDNSAASLEVGQNLTCKIRQLNPTSMPPNKG